MVKEYLVTMKIFNMIRTDTLVGRLTVYVNRLNDM